MLWIKALHIIFMVTWFAGLFYLPRLFVYHAMSTDRATQDQFTVMERKLYFGITTPGGVLTIASGLWLWLGYGIGSQSLWLTAKIALGAGLVGYHPRGGHMVKQVAQDKNRHGHVFYRWFNEFPVLVLVGAVLLVIFKPA